MIANGKDCGRKWRKRSIEQGRAWRTKTCQEKRELDKAEMKEGGIKKKKGERAKEKEREKAWNLREMWWQAGERACAFHVGIR